MSELINPNLKDHPTLFNFLDHSEHARTSPNIEEILAYHDSPHARFVGARALELVVSEHAILGDETLWDTEA